ncbi:MAG: DUF2970 domain-containing protein [Granulosicoccus sp.]
MSRQIDRADSSGNDKAASGDLAPPTQSNARTGTGFWNVVQSVAAAMIGVQSRKNRERDFTHGKPIHFIVGGLVGTLIFLLLVWTLVQYLLLSA